MSSRLDTIAACDRRME